MNTLRDLVPLFTPFVPLLVALIWPITILIILCWFREGIRGLIRSEPQENNLAPHDPPVRNPVSSTAPRQ